MINSDKEIREIIKTLQDIYSGDPWYGPNIRTVIEDIPESELFIRHGCSHSIFELLFHIIAWRLFVIRRLKGEPEEGKIDLENWIDIAHLTNPDLKKIIEKLDEIQEELLLLLESINDSKLSMVVEEKNYTFRKMLTGLMHHDLYHLGQISLLIRGKGNI